jgi:hypothetical protein
MIPNDFDPLDSYSGFIEGPISPSARTPVESDVEPEGPAVKVESLQPNTRIVVATKHSCYRMVLIDPAQKRATVTGGKMFQESTEVRVEGATTGDSVIKPGWIVAGLRMELSIGLKRITTSSVTSVSVEGPSPAPVV